DQQYVKQLAKSLNIPFITEKWKKSEQTKQGSLEENARKKRFEFLIKTATKNKTKIIALAHHKNDIAETVLMRILRGSGLQGLQTILPKRKIENCFFIRPLCNVLATEIKTFLKQKKTSFITDPSNKNTDLFRNKIRLNLIPHLQRNYSSNIVELLSNLSKTASTDYEHLESQCEDIFEKKSKINKSNTSIEFTLDNFTKLHRSQKRMLIRQSIARLQGNTNRLSFKHMENVEAFYIKKTKKSQINLPQKISIKIQANKLIILKTP
ncbi:tRNA(Ile)-lysidine synthetase, partial [hydrothermal vent metagenome]